MNLNKLKRLFNKYFPFILIAVIFFVIILIYILLPKSIAMKVYITIFIISVILSLILEILSKSNQIQIPIQDKKSTITKLYELFDLENAQTIVAINTKDEKILSRAKKLFPGSRESKQNNIYSIMLPKVTLKTIKLFLKDNNPERIIIHHFNQTIKNQPKAIKHSLSICIDNKLIIKYNKKEFTKEEIKNIKEELKN